jgi:hypothetical protein
MAIKFLARRYLTFPELLVRWECQPNDIRQAVLSRALVPSMFIDATLLTGWWDEEYDHETGLAAPNFMADVRHTPSRRVRKFLFMRDPHDTGLMTCSFGTFCDSATATPFDSGDMTWFDPHRQITLDDVVADGVFMSTEVARYEAQNSPNATHEQPESALPERPAATQPERPETTPPEQPEFAPQERQVLQKLLLGMAMDQYKYDPEASRNSAVGDISSATDAIGHLVTDDTVRKHLKAAASEWPPQPRKPNSVKR